MKNLGIIWCLLPWWIVGRIIIVNSCRPFWKGSNLSDHIQILCIHCCLFLCKIRLNLISLSFSCISWSSYHKNLLASSDYEGTVILWDGFTGQRSKVYQVNKNTTYLLLLLLFSRSVVSNSLQSHGLQHTRFPVHHYLQSLFKVMSIESMMTSNNLILCHPVFLLPSIFPSIRVFSSDSLHQVAKILELVARITIVLFNNYRASCIL